MHRTLRRARTLALLASSFTAALVACSGDDGPPGSGPFAPEGEAPTVGDGGAVDGDDGSPAADGAASEDGAIAPTGRGIVLTVDGTTHELATNARASVMGNGYAIQAGKTDGVKLYGVTVQLVRADADGGPAEYVVPTPGTYGCSAKPPKAPYLWARVQYTSPEATYQYGSGPMCVVVTEFGAVGQPVKGTFETTLDRVTASGAPTVTVRGSFDVDRAN